MKNFISPKDNNGAILIISIIIGVIALAAGLTAANFVSRSTRNITDQESSVKALAISESGVEKVLGANDVASFDCPLTDGTLSNPGHIPSLGESLQGGGNVVDSGNCFYKEDIDNDGIFDQSYYLEISSKGGKNTYVMDSLGKDTVLEVSTEGLNSVGLNITWTDNSDSGNFASLLITEVFENGVNSGNYQAKKYAYNRSSAHLSTDQSNNGLDSANNESIDITLSEGTKIIRIKPLYFSAFNINMQLQGGNTFPLADQGFDIYSTGCTCDNVLDPNSRKDSSVRKVKVIKTREHLPAIFDYVLYSGSETVPLTK